MYLEFIFLILDYFNSLKFRIVLYEIILPFVFSIIVFILLKNDNQTMSFSTYKDNVLSLLGILVGFSITIITILTTGQSKNLEEIKKVQTEIVISGKKISLFKLLLINFSYSVVVEIFLIIMNLVYPIITSTCQISINIKLIGFSIMIFSTIHILLLLIRNTTDFYFILRK